VRRIAFAFLAAIAAWPALAQEPVGCDKFKWPLDKERALLATASPAATDAQAVGAGYRISLAADIALPMIPSRAPKPGTNLGFLRLAAPAEAGTYRVTLSDAAWVDVFQDGKALKSGAFSGAVGCTGVRKSVKFDFARAPLLVEISGATTSTIAFVITPD